MNIDEYLKIWHDSDEKEKNNLEFMASVIDYLSSEDRCWTFGDGENGYCGYTCHVFDEYSPWLQYPRFEFAYSSDFVKMFSASHNGFWVPEYIDVSGNDAKPLLKILSSACLKSNGFADE